MGKRSLFSITAAFIAAASYGQHYKAAREALLVLGDEHTSLDRARNNTRLLVQSMQTVIGNVAEHESVKDAAELALELAETNFVSVDPVAANSLGRHLLDLAERIGRRDRLASMDAAFTAAALGDDEHQQERAAKVWLRGMRFYIRDNPVEYLSQIGGADRAAAGLGQDHPLRLAVEKAHEAYNNDPEIRRIREAVHAVVDKRRRSVNPPRSEPQ